MVPVLQAEVGAGSGVQEAQTSESLSASGIIPQKSSLEEEKTGPETRLQAKLQNEAKVHPGDRDAYSMSSRAPGKNKQGLGLYVVQGQSQTGQNKTQVVTHTAPPCIFKVFYLADR